MFINKNPFFLYGCLWLQFYFFAQIYCLQIDQFCPSSLSSAKLKTTSSKINCFDVFQKEQWCSLYARILPLLHLAQLTHVGPIIRRMFKASSLDGREYFTSLQMVKNNKSRMMTVISEGNISCSQSKWLLIKAAKGRGTPNSFSPKSPKDLSGSSQKLSNRKDERKKRYSSPMPQNCKGS